MLATLSRPDSFSTWGLIVSDHNSAYLEVRAVYENAPTHVWNFSNPDCKICVGDWITGVNLATTSSGMMEEFRNATYAVVAFCRPPPPAEACVSGLTVFSLL